LNGVEFDFLSLSGGQQALVVLSLKLALAEISRKRCGAEINLLLLDEVEQALDEEGIDGFYNVIKNMSKNMTLLIITHNKDLKAKFDSVICVNKINDISYAEVK
jgi:DNA repair exonuclease SbcCD ATPase subunit